MKRFLVSILIAASALLPCLAHAQEAPASAAPPTPAVADATTAPSGVLCLFFGEGETPAEPSLAVCLPTYAYAGDQGSSYANPHAATSVSSDVLTYDQNGNLLTKGANNSYTWDYQNRLASSATGVHASSYAYDDTGRRVKLVEDGTTDVFPSRGYEARGGSPTKQIEANGVLVATVSGTGSSDVARYVATDHLTGSSVVTAQDKSLEELLDYLPYGALRIDEKSGAFNERRKFAGHLYDVATSLSYMGARYYDGSSGRFLSQDPLFTALGDRNAVKEISKLDQVTVLSDPQLLNSYSYSRNNPLVYRDADGRFVVPALLAISATAALVGVQLTGAAIDASNSGNYEASNRLNGAAGIAYGVSLFAAGGAAALPAALTAAASPTAQDKAQQILGSSQSMDAVRAAGRAGETASELVKNATRIPSATGTASYRIPDGLDTASRVLGEVKNVSYQSFTNQLRDFASFAQNNGYRFDLYVRSTTQLSQPLQQAVDAGKIILKILKSD